MLRVGQLMQIEVYHKAKHTLTPGVANGTAREVAGHCAADEEEERAVSSQRGRGWEFIQRQGRASPECHLGSVPRQRPQGCSGHFPSEEKPELKAVLNVA